MRTLVGVALAAAMLVTPGIASADEQFEGQTYAEAQQALSAAGMTSRLGTVVGDAVPTQQCTVTGSRTEDIMGTSGFSGGTEVILDLDCNLASAQPSAPPGSEAEADAQQSVEESQMEKEATPGEAG